MNIGDNGGARLRRAGRDSGGLSPRERPRLSTPRQHMWHWDAGGASHALPALAGPSSRLPGGQGDGPHRRCVTPPLSDYK